MRTVPIWLLVAGLAAAAPLRAHAQGVTVANENEAIFAEPGGTRLGRVIRGLSLGQSGARQNHIQATLEGWIFSQSVQRANRDGHNLQVSSAGEENLRETPNGRIIARLVSGALLDELERRGGWVRARRTVWIASSGVTPMGVPSAAATPRPTATPAAVPAPAQDSVVSPADPRRALARRRLQLLRAPDGGAAGSLEPGTPVRVTARVGGWVRVEAQGWVRESEVRLSDPGILAGVSAAELRTTPDEFRGKLLRWTVQYIAMQTADDLRPDFTPGQRYMLARGPAPEYAFVYITVPDARLAEIQRLEPLASLTIVARVLNGRSAYLSNPILELVDIGQ